MLQLYLVTPERTIEKDLTIKEVTLPAFNGELNILQGHAPLMTTLRPGRLVYKLESGEFKEYFIAWGYCQVTQQKVRILAETLEEKSAIDSGQVGQALALLENRITHEILSDDQRQKIDQQIEEMRAKSYFINH